MARPPRILAPDLTYHVTQRGTGPCVIFRDARDRARCIDLMTQVVTSLRWECLAYCLLDTHFHLLVTTPDPNLDRGMKHLNGVYAQGFNRRYGRCRPSRPGSLPRRDRGARGALARGAAIHRAQPGSSGPVSPARALAVEQLPGSTRACASGVHRDAMRCFASSVRRQGRPGASLRAFVDEMLQ